MNEHADMNKYVALFRAINVGGHRKVKMALLREMFSSMGFGNVTTYIQTGNVVFHSGLTDPEAIGRSVEESVKKTFGFEVAVIIRTRGQLEALVRQNPFGGRDREPYMLYVTFFQKPLSAELQKKITELTNDYEFYQFQNGELFSLIDKKTDQKVLFSNNYVEKLAGTPGTTRNWNSVKNILALF